MGVITHFAPHSSEMNYDHNNVQNHDNRTKEQLDEILDHLNKVIKRSKQKRIKFWESADTSSVEQWKKSIEPYRKYFWEEIIGKMPQLSKRIDPKTVLAYRTPRWKGYWVELNVWPNVPTGGILLVPNDLQRGEKRPLIVAEHGLGGKPQEVIDPHINSIYNSFGAKLADEGFIVYAPQSIYGLMPHQTYGSRSFREIQRMANPLKQSIFSVVIGQEEQTLNWLKKLPFVDGKKIGLYGLSYGGKAAMRVPTVLKDYSVVISSGDFNQWIWKTTSLNFPQSYMFLPEYDMYEFNLGNTFNYAEMAGMIAPRPFMVERGHGDQVAPDEWIGYEYAKVQRLYDLLSIGNQTKINFFNGPHQIHGEETFEFLREHLWPKKSTN